MGILRDINLNHDSMLSFLHDDRLFQLKDVWPVMGARRAAGDRHHEGAEQENILLRGNLYRSVLFTHGYTNRLVCYRADVFNVGIAYYSTINLHHANNSANNHNSGDRINNLLFCFSSR